MRAMLIALLLGPTAGCFTPATAIVNGKEVPRPTLEFTGQPYTLRHSRAHPGPGSPSGGLRDGGGTITGTVCGTSVDYEIQHRGDHVQLVGFVDGSFSAQIRVEEKVGVHLFSGALASRVVNLQLFGDRLRGYVGRIPVDLVQEGDTLTSTVYARTAAEGNEMTLRLNGLGALWKLTAAQQAAVLPIMVACLQRLMFDNFARDTPTLGFGGPPSARPSGTLAFR